MSAQVDDFIAGWLGGLAGVFIGHPMDTIKVRQQNFSTSLITTLLRTLNTEGYRGFYKGMLFPIMTYGPSNAIFFGIYGTTLHLRTHQNLVDYDTIMENPQVLHDVFIAGCIAGQVQSLFMCPAELIKTIMQVQTDSSSGWGSRQHRQYKNSIDAFVGILRKRGIRGIYRGGVATALRDVPTSGIYILTYELVLHGAFSKSDTPLIVKQMIAGGCAGLTSWLPVIPIDVVKSRIQADNPNNPMYKGTLDCMVKTYKTEGIRQLFKGLSAIVIRTIPVNACTFVIYEATLNFIHSIKGL